MLLIAGKDLRLRIRDRSVFIIGVIVPFALALVFSLILGDAGDGPIALSFAVVDEDESSIAARFVDALEGIDSDGLAELTILDDESAARSGVTGGDFGAAFVVPAGFGAAVEAGSTATVTVLGNVDSPTSVAIAQAIANTFAANIEGVRLVAATATREGADVASAIAATQSETPALALADVDAADRQLDLSTFFVAGMAVFFLFFTVQFGVTSLLEEKREGTMARLLAAPIDRWSIVGAKATVSFVLGIVSMTVLIVASTLLLDAEWGNPVAVALLVVSGVVSALGIMAVVAAFARTPEGAGNLQSVIAVGLGMLGGIFFPTPLGDGVLSWLAMLTPHRWFMTGLGDLAGGGGIPVVLPSVAALLAFGLVTGALAGIRLRRGVLT
jgi:ABC-2 type transport system permease protein